MNLTSDERGGLYKASKNADQQPKKKSNYLALLDKKYNSKKLVGKSTFMEKSEK